MAQLSLKEIVAPFGQIAREMLPHEITGMLRIACRDGVEDRGVEVAVAGIPSACSPVKRRLALGIEVVKLSREHLAQEPVKAIGAMAWATGSKRKATVEEAVEDVNRSGAIEQGVTYGP